MNYDYMGIWIQMSIEYVFGSGFVFPLAAEFVSVWKSFILKNGKLDFFHFIQRKTSSIISISM